MPARECLATELTVIVYDAPGQTAVVKAPALVDTSKEMRLRCLRKGKGFGEGTRYQGPGRFQ